MTVNTKKRRGDRRDAVLLRDVDSMHFVMPVVFPNRSDNEAFVSERIDLTALEEYLARKNGSDSKYKYNLFQAVVTAALKTVTLRPKMNRFITNRNLYMRNEVSAAFVIKKIFSDNGEEGLAFIRAKDSDNIDTVHDEIFRQVSYCRNDNGEQDETSDAMDMFNKMPRFMGKLLLSFMCFLDRHGKVPESIIRTDPYYSTVLLSNLGSIGLHSGYHHLANWGTNSVFIVVGERKKRPFYDEDGNVEMRSSLDIGLTVDERIADGYYFSKTVRLLKTLLENPELLEKPLSKEVDY